jgi:hypothetical protein
VHQTRIGRATDGGKDANRDDETEVQQQVQSNAAVFRNG